MAKKTTTRTTRKTVKVIGTETYINKDTGELTEMQVINIEERDANFYKLWLTHILTSIDLIGNQKTKLAFWIIDNLDSNNLLPMTQRQIAQKSGVSYQTVSRTLQALIDSNFLQKVNQGVYRVNPDVIFKGGKRDRMSILLQYHDTAAIETEKPESLEPLPKPAPAEKIEIQQLVAESESEYEEEDTKNIKTRHSGK